MDEGKRSDSSKSTYVRPSSSAIKQDHYRQTPFATGTLNREADAISQSP